MFLNRLKAVTASFACLLLSIGLVATAQADIIFTTTGPSSGGEAVSGTADFRIVGSTFEVILTNTSAVGDIGQVLDGLAFTLVGGSGLTLTGVNVQGSPRFEDCTGLSCVGTNTFADHENNPCSINVSLFCWTFSGGLLSAGNGSYKPAGIVDGSITHTDGIPNNEHNDYLNGPVEFDFSFTTAPTSVSSATFYWGTNPDTSSSTSSCTNNCVLQQAPEPGSIALVGLALSGLAWARRRFKA